MKLFNLKTIAALVASLSIFATAQAQTSFRFAYEKLLVLILSTLQPKNLMIYYKKNLEKRLN